MRGEDHRTEGLFSYLSCESRVPARHPLRAIGALVEAALTALSADFTAMYSRIGRPSITPEKLLRALLLQAFYSVRSERQLMEQLDYNLLFRWFVGLSMDAAIWDVTVFTKNRDRLLETDVATKFMAALLNQPNVRVLLSDEHFSVDGTLIEAWASLKSFRPKDGSGHPPNAGRNCERDFRGEKLSNATHVSTSDPDARLYKKAANQSAKLCHMGHLLMENRNCLIVGTRTTLASGTAEREAAAAMVKALDRQEGITLGADKVPFTSFAEPERLPSGKSQQAWFALEESRPLFSFPGIWVPQWTSVRKVKDGPTTDELFGFLTTDPNAEVRPYHPRAMPVIFRTREECDLWMSAPLAKAAHLQSPLPDGLLRIVARGTKEDAGADTAVPPGRLP